MDQLKLAWVYRFWIVIGIIAVMPIVGYFVDTASVAKSADAKAKELDGTKNGLQGSLKGPFPNESWVAAVNDKKTVLNEQVEGAWVELYQRQEPIRMFPKEVHATFIEAGPKGIVKVDTLIEYQKLFLNQIKDLISSVEPRGLPALFPKSKELVEINPELFARYRPVWADPNYPVPPTVPDAWLAQEDIWILRAMMDVVKNANDQAKNWNESPIKRVLDFDLGGTAGDASTRTKGTTPLWSGPDDIVDMSAASKDAQSQGRFLRYWNKNKLYKPVPIRMVLHVDQRKMFQVLAEFASSDVPMEVKQVSIYRNSELPPVGVPTTAAAPPAATAKSGTPKAGTAKTATPKKPEIEERGEAKRKEDEYFHITEIHVFAHAYLYQKPPRVEEEEKAATAKAAVTAPTETAPPAN